MVTIVLDKFLSNSSLYEHIFLENINNLYKYAGKLDNKHLYKDFIKVAMVFTPEGPTKKSQ